MMGAGVNVFAVWNYVIAKANRGTLELNPPLLAFILGGEVKEVEEAIKFLCSEDPRSRSSEEGGRRLVKEGQFQYRVVNWGKYHGIRTKEDQREYNRRKQAEYREQKRLRKSRPLSGEAAAVKAFESGDEGEFDRLSEPRP